jgi:hypothetical protein
MKAFVFGVFATLAVWLWLGGGKDLPDPIVDAAGLDDPLSDYVEVTDQNGRELSCQVMAKRDSFVQIQREADGREFVIALSTLSDSSQERFSRISDFNQEMVDVELLKLAGKEIQPELLYIPELCTYRSKCTGQRMKTREGVKVDNYRDYLRRQGFNYREVSLRVEKAGNGGFYLPTGMKDTPCIRVGETLIYKRSRDKIQEAMIEHYIAKYGS